MDTIEMKLQVSLLENKVKDLEETIQKLKTEVGDFIKPMPKANGDPLASCMVFNPEVYRQSKANYKKATFQYKQTKGQISHGNLFYFFDTTDKSPKAEETHYAWDFGSGSPLDYPRIIPTYFGKFHLCTKTDCILVATDRHQFCQKCNAIVAKEKKHLANIVDKKFRGEQEDVPEDVRPDIPPAKKLKETTEEKED